MLEKLLERFFNEDNGTAADNSGAENIKADVLSRIEREKPMKNFRIKPMIIAAAITAIGAASIAITVNASIDGEAVEEISRAAEQSDTSKLYIVTSPYMGEEWEEYANRDFEYQQKYHTGMVNQAVENGGISTEKEFDESDVSGFVPYNEKTSKGMNGRNVSEKELEFVHQIEEDPGSLGLVPAGKSESFESGLRIVNRHYKNTNEAVDGRKRYYSVRRIYKDDEENTLLASLYLTCVFEFDPDENEIKWYHTGTNPYSHVMKVFLDHTENGCRMINDSSGGGFSFVFADDGTKFDIMQNFFDIRPDPDKKEVRIEQIIAVSSDGIQWID